MWVKSVFVWGFSLLLLYEENLTKDTLIYGEHVLVEQKGFARSGDFSLEDEEYPGWKFEEEKHDEDYYQTQEELTESFGITQAAIWKRFTVNG